METICKRCLSTQRLNVFDVFLVVGWKGNSEWDIFSFNVREEFDFLENSCLHDIFEVSFSKSSVPIVNNMTSVHNLTENVDKIFKWNLRRTWSWLHISVQDEVAVSQITCVEGVRHIPSERSKPLSFNDSRMEEAETEKNTLNFWIFFVDLLFREESKCSLHIGFNSWWWLAC